MALEMVAAISDAVLGFGVGDGPPTPVQCNRLNCHNNNCWSEK
jgi:hypothetical protein